MILFRRYVLLEDWPDIAVIVRISRSQMFQRHSAAIKRLDIKKSGLNRSEPDLIILSTPAKI